MKIAIINYNAGNTKSVQFALERLGIEPVLTSNKKELEQADKVIFPGVGEASSTMNYLKKEGLDIIIKNLQQPVLGICLGMQLLCEFSEEGNTKGVGIFPQKVKRFSAANQLKVPHVGWNNLKLKDVPLMQHLPTENHVYFVHSYYAELSEFTIASCDYGLEFSAALQKDNFYATQFHPEKSGSVGEQILRNFLSI